MRQTKQKKIIEGEIKKAKSFFNAEGLYRKIHEKNPRIGLATVYRSLNNLVKDGKIHSYICERRTIYSTSKSDHCHFKCEKCGKVKHIEIKKLDFLGKQIKGEICHIQIDVSGVCEGCKI